eukprot:TRINITY_DN11733_c0_g1_i2.p1 TRINITY_DN11733_c0_g1~~TRINITY_DN11733_c0_g1_i2.p1  ORF type:complete len:718 (+),score=171.33 TRINITY_DN11733_c0_g1_i2:72-2225(+)
MCIRDSLKSESRHWNLESDRQLLKGIKTTTENTYNGIKGIIDLLENLEQDADDCLIHLKHAVNWVNTLSYSKFIVNEIKPSTEETKKNKTEVKAVKAYENVLEKHRKAIEIAVNDLGIKGIQADDAVHSEGDSLDGRTVAAGGTYVTSQLKGRLPYFIGSKEFRASPSIGLRKEAGKGLSEENLELLKKESAVEAAGENKAEVVGEEPQVAKEPEKQPVIVPVIESKKEKNIMVQTMKISSVHLDVLNSYMPSSSTNPFALADNEEEEDDMILPYNKHLDSNKKEETQIEIAKENHADLKPVARNTVALANKEADEFEKLRKSRISATQAPKPNYMQKMSKLFDFDDDKEDRLKEDPTTLIKKYKKESANTIKSQTIESSISKPKEPSKTSLFADPHEDSVSSKFSEQSPAKHTLSDKKEKLLAVTNATLLTDIEPETSGKKPFDLPSDSEDSSPEETLKTLPIKSSYNQLAQNSSTSAQKDESHATQPNAKTSEAKEDLDKPVARTSSKLFSDFEESKEDSALDSKMPLFGSSAKKKEIGAEKNAFNKLPKKDPAFSNNSVKEKQQLFGSITGEHKPTRESLFGEAVKVDNLFSESTKGKNSLFDSPANMHQSLFNTKIKGSLFAEPVSLNQSLIGAPADSLFEKKSSSPLKKNSLFATIASDGANLFGSSSSKPSESLFKSSADKKQGGTSGSKEAPKKKEISERFAKFLNDDDD